RGLDDLGFALRDVANRYLHELLDLRDLADHVEHDRRVRPLEALVRFAQIAVRVDVEDAEFAVTLGDARDRAVRHGMIAADHADELAGAKLAIDRLVDVAIEPRAEIVDALERADEARIATEPPADCDDLLGIAARFAAPLKHVLGDVAHR